ncbi:MAG: alpha-ketoglutarate-dependent dioxygenase AlkB [Pseudomonadota bacterium]
MLSGFQHISAHLAGSSQSELLGEIRSILTTSPLYVPTMPKSGKPFSVRMTNCGPLGWVSSKEGGYRYQANHPETDRPWAPIPERLLKLWSEITRYPAEPEACLINWYEPGTKLGLHVDADEQDNRAPVLSISIGDDAWFRVGGLTRKAPTERILLRSGDVVVLGGEARLAYHGIDRIVGGTSDLLGQPGRYNLTMRRVTPP